jgi:serine/threonine protein kinase
VSTTLKIDNLNALLATNAAAINASSSPTSIYVLHLIRTGIVDSVESLASNFRFKHSTAEDWVGLLESAKFLKISNGMLELTDLAWKRLALADSSLEALVGHQISGRTTSAEPLEGSYRIEAVLGRGATSITFLGTHILTGRHRTVKVYRPGLVGYSELEGFRSKRQQLRDNAAVASFLDMGEFEIDEDTTREPQTLACQVFEYVNDDARTLQEYVGTEPRPYLSRDFFTLFIEDVGGALQAIEEAGLHHGDLHAGNILVVRRRGGNPAITFRIIDFAAGSSFNSLAFAGLTDLEMFRRHLLWCLTEVARQRPGIAARELVGYRVLRVIEGLREERFETFAQLLEEFYRSRTGAPSPTFHMEPTRRPFEWLRVEFMPSTEQMYMSFEPDDRIWTAIAGSDNVLISGPRGCGKSHYLRALSFWPEILNPETQSKPIRGKLASLGYDYRKFFGVLFPCRLGEFKTFAPDATQGDQFDPHTISTLRGLLILKIVNRTLLAIEDGLESGVIESPRQISRFREFIETHYPDLPVYGDPSAQEEMIQYRRALVTLEKEVEANWTRSSALRGAPLTERDLETFFQSIQEDLDDLRSTQFFVLLDDASEGRVHPEVQKIINSIMTSATRRFCFKVTFDRFLYTLQTSEGREIDPTQDVVYIDLGTLSIKSQKPQADAVRKYTENIVNSRLRTWGVQTVGIREILGDSQTPIEFLSALARPRRKRKVGATLATLASPETSNAYYGGWNIIWHLAHGSVRTLFQLLDRVFADSKFDRTNPTRIDLENQDRSARDFSRQKFSSLLLLPGQIAGNPLGNPLSNVAASLGEVSRRYLAEWDTGDQARFYETISIERLDRRPLNEEAMQILKNLVIQDVFIAQGSNFSRAQIGITERYDLNKIYSPYFQTTYRVRNHLYMALRRFEELLQRPDEWIRKVRKNLGDLVRRSAQSDLFD